MFNVSQQNQLIIRFTRNSTPSHSSDINTYFSYREMVSNDKITIVNI
jgi:hypothetical protein